MVGLGVTFGSTLFATPATAITYQEDATVRFTFNSELSVRLDTANIEILDLTPGTSSDSNVIGITIDTNNMVGYTATASVGDSTYNTTNMIHTNGTNFFASLGIAASESTISTDNTWGYATSTDNGSSWSNFSGLPIYTDTAKEIAVTNSPASDSLKFKINAKAATSQAAGDYRNVINFTVVANVPPKGIDDALGIVYPDPPQDPETHYPTIQSINEEVCDLVEAIDESTVVTDIRDHKNYHVAKLRDGRCWLQDDLALNLTNSSVKQRTTSQNTNANTASLQALFNGGRVEGDSSTDKYATRAVSAFAGSRSYGAPLIDASLENKTIQDYPSSSDTMEEAKDWKFGIYYNYCALSAGSYCYGDDENAGTNYDAPGTAVDAEYDICPVNWRLPTGGQPNGDGGEYYKLQAFYRDSNYQYYTGMRKALRLPMTGYHDGTGVWMQGYDGHWPSATYEQNFPANMAALYSSYYSLDGLNSIGRANGYNVRCITKVTPSVTISFNANYGTGSMPSQGIKVGKTAALSSNGFTRSGYVFNGWNTKADGTGEGYGDMDNYTVSKNTGVSSITLYAQWLQDTGSGSGGGSTVGGRTLQRAFEEAYLYNHGNFDGHKGMYVPEKDAQGNFTGDYHEATSSSEYDGIAARDLRFAMQDVSLLVDGLKVCDRATVVGSEAYVLDLRDKKSYWIAKLKDGKCWMTQNLDYDLENGRALTPATSDVQSNWDPPYSTIHGTAAARDLNSLGWSMRDPYRPLAYDPGFALYYTSPTGTDTQFSSLNECMNALGLIWQDECMHYHVGNIYSQAGVAAKSTIQGISGYANFDTSVCPAGWVPPAGITGSTDSAETTPAYNTLLTGYGIVAPGYTTTGGVKIIKDYVTGKNNDVFGSPLYFVKGGQVNDMSYWRGLGRAEYWDGTFIDSTVFYTTFNTNDTSLAIGQEGWYGRAVRCIAR